ncbi:MAG: LptF/LptG family permease [Planctomycetota bacterium]
MRTLDRYIVRNFLATAGMCLVVILAIRTGLDLFVQMDEFAEVDKPFGEMAGYIADYYGHQMFLYFTELGGIVIAASAAFTLARMNHTNELTAMLASGVSLHRVVWPIILCSLLMAGLIVVDHELIIPRMAGALARRPDSGGQREEIQIRLASDGNRTVWWSQEYHPEQRRMQEPVAVIRDKHHALVATVSAESARPGTLGDISGWQASEAILDSIKAWPVSQSSERIYTQLGPDSAGMETGSSASAFDPDYQMRIEADRVLSSQQAHSATLLNPRFTFQYQPDPDAAQRVYAMVTASAARWVPRGNEGRSYWQLHTGRVFVPSDLDPEELALQTSSRWLEFLSFRQLSALQAQPHQPNRKAVQMARHVRFTNPINNVVLLLLILPFILSRERNIKASGGLSVLMAGGFLAVVYLCRYVGLPPIWGAWMPVLVFGPVAALMLDSIKT